MKTITQKPEKAALKQIIFVLGGPGSGKGTQCDLLLQRFPSYKFFSAGDLLRAEKNSGSDRGAMILEKIKNGLLVPASVTVELLKREMDACPPGTKFLIDGFPRNLDNVTVWNEIMGESCNLQFVLFLECSESIMESRILSRSKTSGRVDDDIAILRKRFVTFRDESMPIVEDFEKKGVVRRVQSDMCVEDVFKVVEGLVLEFE